MEETTRWRAIAVFVTLKTMVAIPGKWVWGNRLQLQHVLTEPQFRCVEVGPDSEARGNTASK